MAQNVELLLCISLLLLLLLPSLSNSATQPLEALNNFEGSVNKLAGLHQLKQYLNKFGYLENHHLSKASDDFDDTLQAAIKTYQTNYNLKITGTLNSETLSKMAVPRCGVPDVINGTNAMRKHEIFSPVSSLNSPRWPADKNHLTYAFGLETTPPKFIPAFVAAFDKWASFMQYHFTFSQTLDYESADIKVGFRKGVHGDGLSFDGRGGILAHAFAPTDGRLHCDMDELWSIGATPDHIDLVTVALHEIGHLLGLDHSTVEDAIMYPTISTGLEKDLHADDFHGIKALYNC